MMQLSIINPVKLKDEGIYVDINHRLEKEDLFESNKIKWIFYGCPYEHIVSIDGNIESKYGFEHALGYIELIDEPYIKYDVLLGLLIQRIEIDIDFDSESDSESKSISEQQLMNDFSCFTKKKFNINYKKPLKIKYDRTCFVNPIKKFKKKFDWGNYNLMTSNKKCQI